VTSTLLNLFLLPPLYAAFGWRRGAAGQEMSTRTQETWAAELPAS
jgi:hypothetical protein